MEKSKQEAVLEIAARIMVSQVERIKLWEADAIDIDALEDISLEIADSLYEKSSHG